VFEIVANPPRRAEAASIVMRVHEDGVALENDQDEVVVPPNPPRVLRWSVPAESRAGETMNLRLSVEDAQGAPVSDLQDRLRVRLGETELRAEISGDEYIVTTPAPERTGNYELFARLELDGQPLLERRATLHVIAGRPDRLVSHAGPLRIGRRHAISFSALDRYGNPSPISHPVIVASGATVERVVNTDSTIIVSIEPTEPNVLLQVRGDYGFADAVSFSAAAAPVRHFEFSLLGTVRSNLGAAVFGGGRFSIGGQFALAHRWEGIATFGVGVEGTVMNDAQNNQASVLAIPLLLRVGVARQIGAWRFGVLAGGVLRATSATLQTADGDVSQQWQWVPGFAGVALVRWLSPVGTFRLELGGETGTLDTVPVRGTLGGIEAALGWGLAI
jgi:hypothetical protein